MSSQHRKCIPNLTKSPVLQVFQNCPIISNFEEHSSQTYCSDLGKIWAIRQSKTRVKSRDFVRFELNRFSLLPRPPGLAFYPRLQTHGTRPRPMRAAAYHWLNAHCALSTHWRCWRLTLSYSYMFLVPAKIYGDIDRKRVLEPISLNIGAPNPNLIKIHLLFKENNNQISGQNF